MTQRMSKMDLEAFLVQEFPQISGDFVIEESAGDTLSMRMKVSHQHLRPGETVSGPSMFALADVSMYLAILARIGPQALAVTTSCSIDFMRKTVAGADLISQTRILKLGRVLAVGDVLIFSEGQGDPVARASLTYSLPPQAPAV